MTWSFNSNDNHLKQSFVSCVTGWWLNGCNVYWGLIYVCSSQLLYYFVKSMACKIWFWLVLVVLMSLIFLFFIFLWIDRATSAVTHVVLGQFKTCVILLGNYYLFSSNPGKTSISGAFTAIAGMSIYTYLNLKQQSSKAPRLSSSLPKSKLSKENGSIHEGNFGSESV